MVEQPPEASVTSKLPAARDTLRAPFVEVAVALEGLHSWRRLLAVALLSLAGFSLVVNHAWNATPDSALYLALGESLAAGQGYVFNGEPHTFVPPGYPVMIASAARVFGKGFCVYRALMAALGLIAVWAAYLFLRQVWGPDTALLVGGLFSVNHVLLHNSTMTLADVPFAAFALIALITLAWASKSSAGAGRTCAAGFLTGLLPLIRVNGLGVPPAGAFFLFFSWKEQGVVRRIALSALFLLLAFAPALLWSLWKPSLPPSPAEGSYAGMILGRDPWYQLMLMTSSVWGYASETTYALSGLVIKTGVLELVLPVICAVGAVAAWRGGDRLLVPLAGIQFGGLLLSPAGSRYLIFLTPVLYLFLALGTIRVTVWLSKRFDVHADPARVLIVSFAILGLCNIGHNLKTVWTALNPVEATGAESQRSVPFFKAAAWLRTHRGGGTVLTTNPRIIHYLTGCHTVGLVRSGVPDQLAWVKDTESIVRLIERAGPGFLFVDAKNRRLYDSAVAAFSRLGLRLRLIPEGSSPPRHLLYRVEPRPGQGG